MSRWRMFTYTLMAMGLLLGLLELGLQLAGFEGRSMAELVATSGFGRSAWVQRRDRVLGDLYVETADGVMESSPAHRQRGLHAARFSRRPDPRVPRFFALGGSTTQGAPWEDRFQGFPQRMGEHLKARGAGRVEIVNTAVGGMDSSAFPGIVKEILDYGPRALILHTGDNELRGRLIYECSNPARLVTERYLNRLATVRLLRTFYVWAWGERHFVVPEDLKRDQESCVQSEIRRILHDLRVREEPTPAGPLPTRADPFLGRTVTALRENLEEVFDLSQRSGVAMVLGIPALNLMYPPRTPHHWPTLPDDDQREEELKDRLAAARDAGDWPAVLALSTAELERDPTHAGYHYLAGIAHLQLGATALARAHLEAAVTWDYNSPRISPVLQEALRGFCAAHEAVICVDLEVAFQAASPAGIPGKELFVDFCHPTFEAGTDLVADSFLAAMQARGLLP